MPDLLLLENGTDHLLLEDASGVLLLETAAPTPTPGTTLWTFVLTDISTGDELVDLSEAVLTAKISSRLNRPMTVQLELSADNADIRTTAADGDPNLVVGTRSIKAYRNGTLRANVIVWQLSYDGDADEAKVSVTGHDPLVQLRRRPARDDTGDFSNPEFGDAVTAGDLVKGIVENTIVWEGDLLIDPDAGTCDAATTLGGNLADWPVMIFDMFTIITDTGAVDVVMTPLDSIAGKLVALNAVDGWGSDSPPALTSTTPPATTPSHQPPVSSTWTRFATSSGTTSAPKSTFSTGAETSPATTPPAPPSTGCTWTSTFTTPARRTPTATCSHNSGSPS